MKPHVIHGVSRVMTPETARLLYPAFERETVKLTGKGVDDLIAYVREGNRRAAEELGTSDEERAKIRADLDNAMTAALAGKIRALEIQEGVQA